MVAKKTPAKKPVKKTAAKSVKKVVKSAPRKRASVKSAAEMKSFRLYKEPKSFVTFKVTRQTLYWIVLLAVIIFTQLWILKVQMDIADSTAALLAS